MFVGVGWLGRMGRAGPLEPAELHGEVSRFGGEYLHPHQGLSASARQSLNETQTRCWPDSGTYGLPTWVQMNCDCARLVGLADVGLLGLAGLGWAGLGGLAG